LTVEISDGVECLQHELLHWGHLEELQQVEFSLVSASSCTRAAWHLTDDFGVALTGVGNDSGNLLQFCLLSLCVRRRSIGDFHNAVGIMLLAVAAIEGVGQQGFPRIIAVADEGVDGLEEFVDELLVFRLCQVAARLALGILLGQFLCRCKTSCLRYSVCT